MKKSFRSIPTAYEMGVEYVSREDVDLPPAPLDGFAVYSGIEGETPQYEGFFPKRWAADRHAAKTHEDVVDGEQVTNRYAEEGAMRYELVLEFRATKPKPGRCCRCGCTDVAACDDGCHWVDDEHVLCSACLNKLFEHAPGAGYRLEVLHDARGELRTISGRVGRG